MGYRIFPTFKLLSGMLLLAGLSIVPLPGAAAVPSPKATSGTLPSLAAPAGVTALAGRVVTTGGAPIEDVLVRDGAVEARTDAAGRFLLEGVAPDITVMVIDARSGRAGAKDKGADYGYYEARVHAKSGMTTTLPFTSYLPKIDHAHDVTISSPTVAPVVVTSPSAPGLEVHIPAGAIITGPDGRPVTRVGITVMPHGRTPIPLPGEGGAPVSVTLQPAGSTITAADGSWLGMQIVYPNYAHALPAARVAFWRYQPYGHGWEPYGMGRVNAAGSQVVPEDDARFYEFPTAMYFLSFGGSAGPGSGPCPSCDPVSGDPAAGDPVSLSTGLFVETTTDLAINDVLPISVQRIYRQGDTNQRDFGVGITSGFEYYLYAGNAFTSVSFIQPDGSQLAFPDTGFHGPDDNPSVFVGYNTTVVPGPFYKATLTGADAITGGGIFKLTRRDGTIYTFNNQFDFAGLATNSGQLLSIQDRFGNKIKLTRGATYPTLVTQITSPNGRWVRFERDAAGSIILATDNIGRKVSYTYDSSERLKTVTDANGHVTTYTWDTVNNRITSITDPLGNDAVTVAYDANGRVQTQTLADGSVYRFTYTLRSTCTNPSILSAPPGCISATSVQDPGGFTRNVTYNADGYVLTDSRAVGTGQERVWTYTRYSNDFTETVTNPRGGVSTYTYDNNGNVLSVAQTWSGAPTLTTYYTYSPNYQKLATIKDTLGDTTTIMRNGLDEPTQITDPLGDWVKLSNYDGEGRVGLITDGLGDQTTLTYGGADLVSVADPLNRVTNLYYDGAGRLQSVTDPLGDQLPLAYDPLWGVSGAADAAGNQVSGTYDANGNLAQVLDPRNGKTTWTYDARNRVTAATDPLGQVTKFTGYNTTYGLPTGVIDRKGQTTNYNWSAFGDLLSASYADGSSVTYGVNPDNGSLASIADSNAGTITRTFGNFDRLMSETTPQGTISYTYDDAGRRQTMTVPGQAQILYTWDNANRLKTIIQGLEVVQIAYDAAGRRQTLTLPNGIVATYGWDAASELTSLTYTNGPTTVGTLTYQYDAAGRISNRGGTLYQSVLPTAMTSATYDADNRLKQSTTPTGGSSLSYDANGNLLSDGIHVYEWDARGRLAGMPGVGSFNYDGLGQRQSANIKGKAISYLYDHGDPVQEQSGGRVLANVLTGQNVDERFTRTEGGTTSTYLVDALGSTMALTNTSGAITTSYAYSSAGVTSVNGIASDNSYQYTGRQNDGTGLYNYRARYYNPAAGRFVGQDPLGFGGRDYNLYRYAFGNAANYKDPNGKFIPVVVAVIAFGAIGGAAADIGYQEYTCPGKPIEWTSVATAAGVGAGLVTIPFISIAAGGAGGGLAALEEVGALETIDNEELALSTSGSGIGGFILGALKSRIDNGGPAGCKCQ
jgi:RHS repeat-associated protein